MTNDSLAERHRRFKETMTLIAILIQVSRADGFEVISKTLEAQTYRDNVALEFSRPGKPTDNAFVESFNGISGRSVWINTGSEVSPRPGR